MNYQRVYDQLIADRRANPPSYDEYVEVHHILPRCLGGADDVENLIRLRPEDHFFAHLLLAKIHGGSLWAAVRIMAAAALGVKPEVRTYRFGKAMPGARARYSAARNWASINLTGINSPKSDKTVYHFTHIDGRECSLTRVEFCSESGINQSHVTGLVRGRYKSACGWYLADRNTADSIGCQRGLNHPAADKTLYSFRNVDGRNYRGTRHELAANENIPSASINTVVTGACLSAYGWYLPDKVPDGIVGRDAQRGCRNGYADNNTYTFRHKDGAEEVCTRHAIVEKYGLDRGTFNVMMSGKSLSSQGWHRVDLNPSGVGGPPKAERNNKFNPTIHHFIHDDGREEKLTLHAMHAKHGYNRASWNKCLSGGTNHGWRLAGTNPKRSLKNTKFTFFSTDGRMFIGTQKQLAVAMGFSDTSAWRVVNRHETSHGWSLKPSNDNKQQDLFAYG